MIEFSIYQPSLAMDLVSLSHACVRGLVLISAQGCILNLYLACNKLRRVQPFTLTSNPNFRLNFGYEKDRVSVLFETAVSGWENKTNQVNIDCLTTVNRRSRRIRVFSDCMWPHLKRNHRTTENPLRFPLHYCKLWQNYFASKCHAAAAEQAYIYLLSVWASLTPACGGFTHTCVYLRCRITIRL